MTSYYCLPLDKEYSAEQVQSLFNVDVDTAYIDTLNESGIYPVVVTEPNFDTGLYTSVLSHSIVGTEAVQVWTPVARPLPEAKENATAQAKVTSNQQASDLITNSGVNVDIWTGAASQAVVDRPPVYNTLLGEMTTIGDNLATTLTAIDTSTSVDEINNIINPPVGLLNTGRGAGLGPEDLNPSYFRIFNSTTLTPSDCELYVPGTSTVIPYDAGLPAPYTFDSVGDCFASGDYELQIRVAATSAVIATLTIPLAVVTNVDIPFTGNLIY